MYFIHHDLYYIKHPFLAIQNPKQSKTISYRSILLKFFETYLYNEIDLEYTTY